MIVHESRQNGDEDLALDQAIAEFLRADSSGKAGDRQQWLSRFPKCAARLLEFFEDRQHMSRIVLPFHAAGLSDSSDLEATTGYDLTRDSVTPPEFAAPRYRPTQFHARGGMGEVWLAQDERIGRQVAIKKLRADRDSCQSRFLIEAQITGQLEHPGVVPLHDLGVDDMGQPYYVMKFIHGRSLGEAIQDYHAHKDRAEWPGDLEFLRLLEAFIGVCNAVAYAHSKGVLHRDIKPANVMLGPFGEVLVLDWGLASILGQPDQSSDAPVRVNSFDSSVSQVGGIVGTPMYMSPEEAQGNVATIDQSSDVYLLGATLYEILTGEPPRQGFSKWELLEAARTRRPVPPRKKDLRIPRALEAICLKAMGFQKRERYATAAALSEDLQRYLCGEPTIAYRERVPERIVRWVRRHRRGLAHGAMATAMLTLCALAVQQHRHANLLSAREQGRIAWNDFRRLVDETQFYAANTDVVSERAPYYDPGRASELGKAALAIAAPWGDRAELLPLPELRSEVQQARYDLLLLMARTKLLGNSSDADLRAALQLLEAASRFRTPSRGYSELRSRCLARLGEQEFARREVERSQRSDMRESAEDHFLAGELLRLEDSAFETDAARNLPMPRRESLTKAIAEYRAALRLDPRHYWAQLQLGRCLLGLGRGPESVEAFAACVALRPDSPWAYSSRGLANALSGRLEEGLSDLNQAVEIDPGFQAARLNRGLVYLLRDETEQAMTDFTAVVAAAPGKQLIEAAYYRGQLLLKTDRAKDALADASLVIAARPDFRPAYWLRTQARFRLGKYDEGLADLARFVTLGRRKPASNPGVAARTALGKALRQLALELDGEARTQALIRATRELETAIATGSPTAEAYEHLGGAQQSLGQVQQAIASYSRGLALEATRVPLRNMRGWAYAERERFDLAGADFSEALRHEPDNPESHTGLGFALAEGATVDDSHMQAVAATLSGANDYRVLHNVACIYGRLSKSATTNKIEYEDMALAALKRAVALARQNAAGPAEIALARQETAFPDSLCARAEFQQLLSGNATIED